MHYILTAHLYKKNMFLIPQQSIYSLDMFAK